MFKSLLLTFLSLFLLSVLLPVVHYDSWVTLFIASLVLWLLNGTLRPILQLLFLPMNVITLGIFGWLINGAVLGLAVYLVPNFELHSITPFGVQIGWVLSLMLLSLLLTILQRLIDLVI
jgi:putative membrane protein